MLPSERLLKDRVQPRLNMVNYQLRSNDIRDAHLIQAFETIPMEVFVPPATQSLVYSDADLPLTEGMGSKRWLLAPLTLGKLLQLASIRPVDKVLIVGCGSGYSLALVAQLADQVIGIESCEDLAEVAHTYGAEQGISNIQVVVGALSVGYPKGAPYDVILIEGAVSRIPSLILQQLAPQQGRLVTVIKEQTRSGQTEFGKGVLITRTDDRVNQTAKFDASCPYLPEFEPSRRFQL